MGKSNELEIRILAKNLAKEALADARKDLQGVGDAAKKGGASAKEGSKGIGDMVGALQKAASAYALVKVAQQAIEWAKEGAAIDAVEKRFIAFAGSAAAAEGILRAVGEATGGTIDRMSTMQSASKLMSMGLANNAEEVARLVEMATKLGDQTQATGDRVSAFGMMLANQSVEVLDNYGISSGQVRERIKELMAASSDMSREQAFLQATLELGEKTLVRLGDSTENMASSWDRLGAKIADGTGKFKQLVAEGLTPAAEGLYQVLSFSGRVNEALALNSDEAIASGKGWDQYAQTQLDAQYKAGRGNAVLREVNKALRENGERVLYSTATSENWNYVMGKAIEYGIGYKDTLDRLSYEAIIAGNQAAAQGFSDVGASAGSAQESISAVADAAKLSAIAFYDAAAGLNGMSAASMVSTQLALLKAEVEAGTLSLDQYTAAQFALLTATGLLTANEIQAQGALNAMRAAYVGGKVDVDTYAAGVSSLQAAMARLTDKEVTIRVKMMIENLGGPGGMNQAEIDAITQHSSNRGYAGGGVTPTAGWAMVGEQGPEMAWLPQGTRIHTAGETKRMLSEGAAGGRTEVYAPVTIHANVANGVDVALLARQVSDEIGRRVANRRAF